MVMQTLLSLVAIVIAIGSVIFSAIQVRILLIKLSFSRQRQSYHITWKLSLA